MACSVCLCRPHRDGCPEAPDVAGECDDCGRWHKSSVPCEEATDAPLYDPPEDDPREDR